MTLVVRAFPVSSGEAAEKLAHEVRSRKDDAHAFYRAHNVRHESWFLQETEHGPIVIGVTDVEGPVEEPAAKFAAAAEGFAAWFKKRVLEISGVDENEKPLGPESRLIYEFRGGAEDPSRRSG